MDPTTQSNIDRIEKLAVLSEERGKHLEMLDYMEKAYIYRRQVLDSGSPILARSYENLVTKYNVVAMQLLSEGVYFGTG